MDKKNLEFASLLHDIGKFYQRSVLDSKYYGNPKYDLDKDVVGYTGAHAKWSADFLDKHFNDYVVNLALCHHNPNACENKFLANIVKYADNHSASEREKGEELDPKKTPFVSIFSKINILDECKSEVYNVPLRKIDSKFKLENIFPKTNVFRNLFLKFHHLKKPKVV